MLVRPIKPAAGSLLTIQHRFYTKLTNQQGVPTIQHVQEPFKHFGVVWYIAQPNQSAQLAGQDTAIAWRPNARSVQFLGQVKFLAP